MENIWNQLADVDLNQLGEHVHIMQMREGVDIVALPIGDYNILIRRLAKAYQRHSYLTDMPPVEGTFIWHGVTFTSLLRHDSREQLPGEEVTDTSDWFQEDWDPEWSKQRY